MSKDGVEDVKLTLFEPPRFFEALLRGRHFTEAPDVTARICGICPIAYQMSAVHALERITGTRVNGALREIRRLIYCGEWIESHALHVLMLHAPDFLGYSDFIEMSKKHRKEVEDGLFLKKTGNEIMALFGGREIHPINVRVGGFYKLPSKEEARGLLERIRESRARTESLIRWAASFDFPHLERDYELVALKHPDEYPFNEGTIASTRGLEIEPEEFETHYEEYQADYTHALHCRTKDGHPYLVGPLARYALNFDRLPDPVKDLAAEIGLPPVVRNPFKSILVRGLEVMFSLIEAERILESYERPAAPFVDVPVRAGTGWGATEAPRGLLYHRYRIDEEGLIEDAQIVPPTSQNQLSIEADLRALVPTILNETDETITWRCEQAIRNYDPCISCATHFLRVEFQREESA